jgi:hypothetical protein
MLSPEESDILAKLHETNAKLKGICFALAMREEDGTIKIHEREHQPCYGELRKYEETHGAEATQPEGRPDDLYSPFPKGTPEALAIGFPSWFKVKGTGDTHDHMKKEEVANFFDFIISNQSPFIKGFGGLKNVEWSPDRRGIVLLDLEIDPTVLVNMLKTIQHNDPVRGGLDRTRFHRYRVSGLSSMQAFCAMYTANHNGGTLFKPYEYIYPMFADLNRIVSQDPRDLTGGTLKDRFDYSRKNLHEVFYSQEDGVNVFQQILKKTGKKWGGWGGVLMTEEEFLKSFLSVWDEYFNEIEKEKAA